MLKVALTGIVAVVFLLAVQHGFAQDEEITIEGNVQSFSSADGILIVDGKQILLPEESKEDWYLEEGDKVRVLVRETDSGLIGIDYDFIWDDDYYADEAEEDYDEAEPGL